MPILLVRRESDHTLTSVYPAVWEAHDGDPAIEDIQPIAIEGGNNLDVGFIINLKNTNQKLLVISLYNQGDFAPEIRTIYHSEHSNQLLEFAGDLLVATLQNSVLQDIHLWNCEKLSSVAESIDFSGTGWHSGEVAQIIRKQKKFILSSTRKLPVHVSPGSCIIVELPDGKQEGFLIETWERSTDQPFKAVVTLQGDPGLNGNARAGTLQRMTYPRKVFPPLTYTGIKWKLSNHSHLKSNNNGH